MFSCPEYSVNTESYISCRILIHNGFKLGIQCLSLKRSLSFILREYFNIKTLILIFIKKIYYSSYIIIINLIKILLYFLTLFHYFSINNFIDEFNLMVSLFFFWDFDSVILLLSL